MLEQPLSTASVWTRYHWLSSLCLSFWLLWRLKATVESRLKRPSPRLWTQRRKLFAHVMRLHSLFLTWRLEILFPVALLLGWVLSLSKAQRWNSLTWRPSHSRINIVCSQILAPPILSIIWTRFDFLVLVTTPATLRRALHGCHSSLNGGVPTQNQLFRRGPTITLYGEMSLLVRWPLLGAISHFRFRLTLFETYTSRTIPVASQDSEYKVKMPSKCTYLRKIPSRNKWTNKQYFRFILLMFHPPGVSESLDSTEKYFWILFRVSKHLMSPTLVTISSMPFELLALGLNPRVLNYSCSNAQRSPLPASG